MKILPSFPTSCFASRTRKPAGEELYRPVLKQLVILHSVSKFFNTGADKVKGIFNKFLAALAWTCSRPSAIKNYFSKKPVQKLEPKATPLSSTNHDELMTSHKARRAEISSQRTTDAEIEKAVNFGKQMALVANQPKPTLVSFEATTAAALLANRNASSAKKEDVAEINRAVNFGKQMALVANQPKPTLMSFESTTAAALLTNHKVALQEQKPTSVSLLDRVAGFIVNSFLVLAGQENK